MFLRVSCRQCIYYIHLIFILCDVLFDSLDQTLGKPGAWFAGSDRDKQKATIVARLSRVENQVGTCR